MTTKTTITIRNDDEGMFSGMTSAEMETVDIPATLAAYEAELSAALAAEFSEYEFELEHGPYAGRSIIGLSDDHDTAETVGETIARVYERGTFWKTK